MGSTLTRSNKYRTSKVNNMESFQEQSSTMNPNEGSADEFEICRLLVPSRIIEYYMTKATSIMERHSSTANDDENTSEYPLMEMKPYAEQYDAAVLFADISGFSRLAEELQKELGDATNAAEDLSNYVGNSLNKMVEVITEAGGDVIKFAGDAILAVFPTSESSNLAASTLTACRVALDLLNLKLSAGSVELSVHCGVGSGTLIGYHVGGLNNRWEYFISGPILEQVGSAEKEAEAKEVVISSETLVLMVQGIVACMPKSAVPRELRTIIANTSLPQTPMELEQTVRAMEPIINKGDVPCFVQRLPSESGNYKLTTLGVSGQVQRINKEAKNKRTSVLNALNPDSPACAILLRALKCYIPGPVLLSISAKQSLWSAQFWLCSTMFIRLEGLTFESLEYVDHLQQVLLTIQQELYEYQGTLCRMIVDDKGTGILAAFGLPPFAQHENDAVRATKVAMNVVQIMKTKFNHSCSVGVTSGRVYAGVVGGRTRCEYTLHGSVVNLAARLMVASGKNDDGVFVNDVVFRAANNEIEFDDPVHIRCKGYDHPIPVYRPHVVREEPLEASDEMHDIQLICAPSALTMVKTALTHAAQVDSGGLVLVEGEAGMGKSRMCRFICKTGADSGFNVIRAASYDSAPPYYLWKQLLSSLLGLKRYRSSREKMLECLVDAIPPHQRQLAPLLKDVFIGITDDNVETATLTGQPRSEELSSLIINMLRVWFEKYVPEVLNNDATRLKGIIHMKTNVTKPSKKGLFRANSGEPEPAPMMKDEKGLNACDLTPKAMKLLGMSTNMDETNLNLNDPEMLTINTTNANQESKLSKKSSRNKSKNGFKRADSVRYTMSIELDKIPHVGHMFVCEDVHWMDEASISLLVRAVCEFPDVLFVLSGRPTDGMVVGEYINELLAFEDTVHLELQPFTEAQVEEAIKLIVQGATSVDRKLVRSVYKRVQGHPLFTLELIKMLDSLGKLGTDGRSSDGSKTNQGKCSLVGLTDFTELALPDTVRGLMTGKFNRIEDNEIRTKMQQVLKVASVFGSEFPVDLLLETIPREQLLTERGPKSNIEHLKVDENVMRQQKELETYLEGLEQMGFIAQLTASSSEATTEGTCYRFEQSMMRQCAYDMLLFEHRRNYHSRIAHLIERRNAGCVDLVYAVLAQHFFKAEDAPKAIEYLEKAAQMHFAAYQMEAAKNCFSRLLRITGDLYGPLPMDIQSRAWKRGVKDVPAIVTPLKKAQWTRFMGEILVDQQEYATASLYFLSALQILRLPPPPTTKAGRMMSNFKLNRTSAVSVLRSSMESVILLEAAREYSCIGSNIEAQHARAHALSLSTSPYPYQKLENIYLFALKYALAANQPKEPGFVVACSNMAAALATATGASDKVLTLYRIAEKQLSQVTDIKAQISVRTNLANYALLECNYTRAEKVLQELIWTAHFHHLRAVQLRGLELMWVLKRMEGNTNDMLAVAAEIREIEPVLGLIFEAFGAAEVGDFEECARSLEGIRRLNGATYNYRNTKQDRLSHQERLSVYHEAPAHSTKHRTSSASGRLSNIKKKTNNRAQKLSMVGNPGSYSPRTSSAQPSLRSPRRGQSTSSMRSPRKGGSVELETAVENISDFMDAMPRTLSTAAAVAHYCLKCGHAKSGMVAALRGLGQYRQGVMSMRMFDFFSVSSCIVAVCQAQVLQPSLLGFDENGENAESILSASLAFLFRFAKFKPCCKVMKKYVRGWNAARKKSSRKASKTHWKKAMLYSTKYSNLLDTPKIQLSTTAMANVCGGRGSGSRDTQKPTLRQKISVDEPLVLMYTSMYKDGASGTETSSTSTGKKSTFSSRMVDEDFQREHKNNCMMEQKVGHL